MYVCAVATMLDQEVNGSLYLLQSFLADND